MPDKNSRTEQHFTLTKLMEQHSLGELDTADKIEVMQNNGTVHYSKAEVKEQPPKNFGTPDVDGH